MQQIRANNLTFEVEDLGPKTAPPVVLIMGLAAQMTFWPDALIQSLLNDGMRVIRFDNRDVGLSHKFDGRRAPHPFLQIAAQRFGFSGRAPYTLHDMVDDTVGILDALDIERAHLVGVSMGGMIAQLMAGTAPDRVASLTSIMSGTLNPRLPRPSPKLARALFLNQPRDQSREALIERSIKMYSLIRSPDAGEDGMDDLRAKMSEAFDRSHYPQGVRRQLAAIIATGDLRPFLRQIGAPALIIHGAQDPLVPVEAGRDSARTIRNAKLEILSGMAHDLPKKHVPHIAKLIAAHVKAASPAKRTRVTAR
jgi:pimeloyl-ACP methyl ester carboxylesterase